MSEGSGLARWKTEGFQRVRYPRHGGTINLSFAPNRFVAADLLYATASYTAASLLRVLDAKSCATDSVHNFFCFTSGREREHQLKQKTAVTRS